MQVMDACLLAIFVVLVSFVSGYYIGWHRGMYDMAVFLIQRKRGVTR